MAASSSVWRSARHGLSGLWYGGRVKFLQGAPHDAQGTHLVCLMKVAGEEAHHVLAQVAAALIAEENGEPPITDHVCRGVLATLAIGGIRRERRRVIAFCQGAQDRLAGFTRFEHGKGHAKGENRIGKTVGVADAQPAAAYGGLQA